MSEVRREPNGRASISPEDGRVDVFPEIRQFWDEDAATYDRSPSHQPVRPQELAAWAGALRQLLPEPPARVLDIGAGTGFPSLLLAAQGYQITAADLSPGMLARLRAKAGRLGLEVTTVEADALHPPAGDYDAVMERLVLWTLPDPAAALAAWRAAAPRARLALIESSWGNLTGIDKLRAGARIAANRLRHTPPAHHGDYSEEVLSALPHAGGLPPEAAIELVRASGWGQARLVRLRDVEWAIVEGRGLLADLLGTFPRWAVVAGA
jgi:SAM-dependent methyltransferase